MSKKQVSTIALFSGGLDSILACRLMMAQGIKVTAVRFVTPFFGYELLAREKDYAREAADKYGIDVQLRDISEKYLEMLGNPAHGYGKNFNPCVDCKIMIASESRAVMEEQGASFLISGEVLGQRPMSQRRDTLRVIERDSGCDDILLRPLCALNLTETKPEREGLVNREELRGFTGRSRQPQMELAASFGISDYPSPAGGCVLTDPIKSARIRRFYDLREQVIIPDVRLLLAGRQFLLPSGGWLVLGRTEVENNVVTGMQQPGDLLFSFRDWPGPEAVLRGGGGDRDLKLAVGIMKRYSKKGAGRDSAVVLYKEAGIDRTGELYFPVIEELELGELGTW
jgi:tRNA-specific 2-thiouridylase